MGMTTENVIVAGVDGSTSATAAALWAASEAHRRHASLCLVQAYSTPAGFAGPGVMIAAEDEQAVRLRAQKMLIDTRETVTKSYPEIDVRIELHHGHPATVLRNASAGVLLTVLGAHGDRPFVDSMLGSVAQKVAAHAHGPVVVIRSDPDLDRVDAGGPVLVGLDGSPESSDALSFAFEEASLRGVGLIAIHSWDTEARPGLINLFSPEQDRAGFEQEQRVLAEQLAGWADKHPDVPVRSLVVRGQSAAAIMGHDGESADGRRPSLIVVGSRGRGGFIGLLLGSTSQALILHAHCPVAVVRAVRHG
jgi:nucleotide-binding universal stress UspA family protein